MSQRGLPLVWVALAGALGWLALGSDTSLARSVPPSVTPRIPDGPVWVVGDSIGVGIAAALRRAGVKVVERAQNSTNARQWAGRLPDAEYWPEEPRTIVVSLGTNDAISAELRKEFMVHARTIARTLLAAGHQVIWVLPPSKDSRIPQDGDINTLIAFGGSWILERDLVMADKWHPTAAGYDTLASVVLRVRQGR